MSALSSRDRALAAGLPALVIFLGGWIFILRPAGREIAGLRQRVENQGELAPRQAAVAAARARGADLEKSLLVKRQSLTKAGAFDHNLAMRRVSQLCSDFGLSLNATEAEPAGNLPQSLRDASAALGENADGSKPQVWRIEMSGSYAAVLRLLEDLGHSEPLIVPISISMETDRRELSDPKWKLRLWL